MWNDSMIQSVIVRTDMMICEIVPVLVVLLLLGAAAFLIHLIWKKMKGDTNMKKHYPEEIFEAEDLSCAEDEDRIFILDENGKSVEVEVEDDVADD